MQEHLYNHFESEGHTEFLDDILIRQTVLILLREKITGCEPLKHLHPPYGFNVVNSI